MEKESYISTAASYLNTIDKIPILTEEEEKTVIKRIENGDTDAKELLVTSNLRWVVKIAKSYLNRCHNLSFMDIIQEGNKGLMIAADRFDSGKQVRFTTYATYWIKNTISKAIAENNRMIRIPANIIVQLSKMNKIIKALSQKLNREPSIKEIASEMGVTEKIVKNLMQYNLDTRSLDETINEDKDVTVGDMVADENSFNNTAIEDEGLSAELMKSLNSLEEREKEVLMLRFGFYGGNGMTLEEVGKKINLSKERVRQIEKKALEKMRHPIRCKKLKEFL